MKADKRQATFGRAYWVKPHPDVPRIVARIHILRRDWRALRWLVAKRMVPVIAQAAEQFDRLTKTAQTAVLSLAEASRAARQYYELTNESEER